MTLSRSKRNAQFAFLAFFVLVPFLVGCNKEAPTPDASTGYNPNAGKGGSKPAAPRVSTGRRSAPAN